MCDTPQKQAQKSFAILSLQVSRDMESIATGPLSPPPCSDKSSETLLVWCVVLLFGFFGMDVGYSVWFFGLWGWIVVWFGALQDLTPVSQDACCPLFLCDCVVCSPTIFFLFFSLSGVGETQTPLGFVLPLVSLLPGRALRPQPVLRRLHLHQGIRPAPVFFLRRRSSFWW